MLINQEVKSIKLTTYRSVKSAGIQTYPRHLLPKRRYRVSMTRTVSHKQGLIISGNGFSFTWKSGLIFTCAEVSNRIMIVFFSRLDRRICIHSRRLNFKSCIVAGRARLKIFGTVQSPILNFLEPVKGSETS